ncbi:hypothetical protein [Nostoc sp. LEGE 06077]|uniref:hypothetical protein n=1 Tax=Nostoc sp. LEGE 06077 TaxID=915325 RepID=UPI001881494A|nr:hypothetical protein [Nostoc sp. LEGE 06077]
MILSISLEEARVDHLTVAIAIILIYFAGDGENSLNFLSPYFPIGLGSQDL